MTEELCEQNSNKGFVVEKNGFLVCLINFNIYVTSDDAENEIQKITNQAYDIMQQEFNIKAYILRQQNAYRLPVPLRRIYGGTVGDGL